MEIDYAVNLHQKFASRAGSDQIALPISLRTLLKLLNERSPLEVLELGAGIGTITEMLLERTPATVTCVENNDFCIGRIRENLKNYRKFNLLTDYAHVDAGHPADFLIIDVNVGIYSVKKLVSNSLKLNLIFVEGHQLIHRLEISETLHKTRRRQKLIDVRDGRGTKGCAYFEIDKDNSLFRWRMHLDFLSTYVPLKLMYAAVKFRRLIASYLDRLEKFSTVRLARKLWQGKIPWSF